MAAHSCSGGQCPVASLTVSVAADWEWQLSGYEPGRKPCVCLCRDEYGLAGMFMGTAAEPSLTQPPAAPATASPPLLLQAAGSN